MNVQLVSGDAAIIMWLDQAAALIGQEFPRPSMQMTPEMLQWHLTGVEFDRVRPLVALATQGDQLVGFAGATPRPLNWKNHTAIAHVVSFVCVASGQQARGLGAALYDRLLNAIKVERGRVLTFAIDGSSGMRLLERAYPRLGFVGASLGLLSSRAILRGRVRRGAAPAGARSGDDIGLASGAEVRRHLDADPRGTFVDRAGVRSIAAKRLTSEGVEPLLLVEHVPLDMSATALADSLIDAFDAFPAHGNLVVVPNCSAVDPAVATAVGLRQLAGPVYRSWFWSADPCDPFLNARSTSHPVV